MKILGAAIRFCKRVESLLVRLSIVEECCCVVGLLESPMERSMDAGSAAEVVGNVWSWRRMLAALSHFSNKRSVSCSKGGASLEKRLAHAVFASRIKDSSWAWLMLGTDVRSLEACGMEGVVST